VAAKPATERPSGAIPLSPLPAATKVAATPKATPAVPPSVLVGAATAAAAARGEAPVGSFDEIEIDEMVDGLHEAAGSADFGIDSGAWSGGASLDPAGATSFAAAQDDGFFLGEPDPDPAPAAATAVLAAREVARLRVGETREIVVPVEIRDGSRAKQFRLALTLRLDPAD
jgi:hypothetical protein